MRLIYKREIRKEVSKWRVYITVYKKRRTSKRERNVCGVCVFRRRAARDRKLNVDRAREGTTFGARVVSVYVQFGYIHVYKASCAQSGEHKKL